MASLKDCPVLCDLIYAAFKNISDDVVFHKFKCTRDKGIGYYEWRHMILDLIVELDMIPRKKGTEVHYSYPKHSWMIMIYNGLLNIQINIIKNGLVMMFRRDDKGVSWHGTLKSLFFLYGVGDKNDDLWSEVTKGRIEFNQDLVVSMEKNFKKKLVLCE